jgi:hypothetical protein
MKVTLPVASDGVTVAVKVTESPYTDGFSELTRSVDVEVPSAMATPGSTGIARSAASPATTRWRAIRGYTRTSCGCVRVGV